MIGKYPLSINLKYIPCGGEELAEQFEDHTDETISYDYIVYYDEDAQNNKISTEYNHLASQFTNRKFWGRVMIIDNNPNTPIINAIDVTTDYHSF